MNRLPLYALLALAASCALGETDTNTKTKGDAPAKDNDGAKGGDAQSGQHTEDATAQATVESDLGGESTLYVVNLTSDYDICYIYADTCDGVESGELLGDYYLPPDYYLAVSGLPDDCYDLWAFDCDDSAVWNYETDIAGELTWILTSSGGGGDTGGDTGDSGF